VRFDRCLLDLRNEILALEDVIRLGKPLVHIADVDKDVRGQVARAIRFPEVDIVRLVMDDGCTGLECVARIDDYRKLLVLDLDEVHCSQGNLLRLSRDQRHAVAHEPHLMIQRERIQRRRQRMRLTGRAMSDAGHVLIGQHCGHAWQLPCFGDIDRFDARVGHRAVHDLADQHAAHVEVIGECRLALAEFHRVDFCHGLADDAQLLARRSHQQHGRRVGSGGDTSPGRLRAREVSDAWLHSAEVKGNRQAALIPGMDRNVTGHRFLAAQSRRGFQHGSDRFGVAGAAAEDARQRLADFGLADRLRFSSVVTLSIEQLLRGQQLGRSTVAALDCAQLDECLLQWVKPGRLFPSLFCNLAESLSGADATPIDLRKQHVA